MFDQTGLNAPQIKKLRNPGQAGMATGDVWLQTIHRPVTQRPMT
jgi:hypothetical protein